MIPNLYDRAAVIPGRSMTRSKAVFGRWAVSGWDACLRLSDNNGECIDMLCALGARSLGHLVTTHTSRSDGCFSLPHELEVEAAEAALLDVAPWASWARFVKTGSEATHAAYRIAKATTGRHFVLRGDWSYHGWFEWCSDESETCQTFPHGADFGQIARENLAAVFIEPHRWEPVSVEWLRSVREFCDRTGALLVFDSMIYGGRMALGGTSEYFGVIPDLECFGKAFGNGEAVAFVVGTEKTYAHGDIPSGTYSGDVTGLSAFLDTLVVYTSEPVIETLWARGRQLEAGLNALVSEFPDVLAGRDGLPPHQRLRFVRTEDGERFTQEMLKRGVIWHPGCANVMYAHTEAQIDTVITAARESAQCLSR